MKTILLLACLVLLTAANKKMVTVDLRSEKNYSYQIIGHEISQECTKNSCHNLIVDYTSNSSAIIFIPLNYGVLFLEIDATGEMSIYPTRICRPSLFFRDGNTVYFLCINGQVNAICLFKIVTSKHLLAYMVKEFFIPKCVGNFSNFSNFLEIKDANNHMIVFGLHYFVYAVFRTTVDFILMSFHFPHFAKIVHYLMYEQNDILAFSEDG